jgi:hypothetical protein
MCRVRLLIGIWLMGWLSAAARAGDDAPAPEAAHIPCRGPYVLCVAPWARPSVTPAYTGYYVGGGCLWRGDPHDRLDGTWGWDYEGNCFCRRIMLKWCHCRRYQDGTGSYQTEAPHRVDLPKVHPHEHGE